MPQQWKCRRFCGHFVPSFLVTRYDLGVIFLSLAHSFSASMLAIAGGPYLQYMQKEAEPLASKCVKKCTSKKQKISAEFLATRSRFWANMCGPIASTKQ